MTHYETPSSTPPRPVALTCIAQKLAVSLHLRINEVTQVAVNDLSYPSLEVKIDDMKLGGSAIEQFHIS